MNGTSTWFRRFVSIALMAVLLVFVGVSTSCSPAEEGDAEGSLPASFDLRDVDGHCYVTPVKLQNPFGACWGFAAMAAAETSVPGSHLADDPDAYKTLDFSEKQLAYFSHTAFDLHAVREVQAPSKTTRVATRPKADANHPRRLATLTSLWHSIVKPESP